MPPMQATRSVQAAAAFDMGVPALRIGVELLKVIRSNLVTVVTGAVISVLQAVQRRSITKP